jgi:hypothetical protein
MGRIFEKKNIFLNEIFLLFVIIYLSWMIYHFLFVI